EERVEEERHHHPESGVGPVGDVEPEELVERQQRERQPEEERGGVNRAEEEALEDPPVELPEGVRLAPAEERQAGHQQVEEEGELEEPGGLEGLGPAGEAEP